MEKHPPLSVSVNECSSTQDVTLIPPQPLYMRKMVGRVQNIDVDTILTQIHGPGTHTAQTNLHVATNQLSSKLTSQTTITLSVSADQTNQPPPKSPQEKELHRNKKTLKAAIAKATAKLEEIKELKLRASMSYLEVEKPVFECSELTHPIKFLECLKVYLKRVPNEKKIDTVLECLEGGAKDWAGALKEHWSAYEDFEKSFIEEYWGESLQNLLRSEILNGKYEYNDEAEDETMANYFINLVGQARWLLYQIPDGVLIYDIMRHFPKKVQLGWYGTVLRQNRTVLEAVEFLRKMDEIEILSNAQIKYQKTTYKLRVRENASTDCAINLNKQMIKKIEEIRESLNKVIAIKEGIKVAETASSKMCISQQQKQCANSAYNEKVLRALVKLNNINKEINDLEEHIKSNLNNIRRPDFTSPKFSHPLNFLEDLTDYFEKIPSEYRTVENIVDCLYGNAHSWATIYKERWSTIDYFKKDFIEHYWGSAEQTLLRREIVCGDWDARSKTMTQHFTRLVNQAKFVTWPISDKELVFDIMRHFSKYVQVLWRSSGQSTILEATAFLQKMDKEVDELLNTQIQSNTSQDNMTEMKDENISYIGERRVFLNTANTVNQRNENNIEVPSRTSMLSDEQQQTKRNKVDKNLNEIAKFLKHKSENGKKKKIKRLTNTNNHQTNAAWSRTSENGVNPRDAGATTSQTI